MSKIYRGVPANHPQIAAAHKGRAVPEDINGNITPEQHNLGGAGAKSPYTSWTRNYELACRFARRDGPGGVVLSLDTRAPFASETWYWELSPDDYGEEEIPLHGEGPDATVEEI
jgi:hypothetical protein